MAIVTIQTPQGQSVKIDAPEGATDDQIFRFAKSQGLFEQQTQPETTIGEDVVGGIENAVNIASGIVAEPLAGIAGIAQAINPFAEEGAGARAVKDVRSALTIQPKTEAGQSQQQAIGETLAPVGEALQVAETTLGENALDMTGSPFIASIAHSLPTVALEVLGFKGSKLAKGGIKTPKASEVKKAIVESAPEVEQLKNAARAVYNEIDTSGVRIKKGNINGLVNRVEAKTRKNGLDPRVTKQAAGALEALKEIKNADQPITELMTQRKIAQNVASSVDPAEKMLGSMMIDEIDSFVDSLTPQQLSKGDAATGKKVKAANSLWGRARRAEDINEAIEQGANAASGVENGIRVKFRQIINNKKKSKFFSKGDLDSIKDVVEGDFKTNFAKFIGRTGGFEGASTNMLGTLGGSAAGGALLGPVGAFAIPAIGVVSKRIAQNLTKGKANFTSALVRAGNDANEITKIYLTAVPKAKRSAQDLADLLSDPKVNIDDLKMIANETLRDAVDIAKGQRLMNAAGGAFLAGTAQSIKAEEQHK